MATCSCGCASVGLDVASGAPAAELAANASPTADPGWIPIVAVEETARGGLQVTRHVVDGRLHEVELWTGVHGERPAVDPERLVPRPC